MAVATEQTVLPLLVAGLPRTFLGWLRTAGIPFSGYVSGSSLKEFLSKNPGRFLIYDSRNLTSRHEAETALGHQCVIIDMAPTAPSEFDTIETRDDVSAHSISGAEWILSLKRKLQQQQGLWLRIHDLPAGYEAVAFRDGLPRQPELRLVAESLSVLGLDSRHVPSPHFPLDHVFHSDNSSQIGQSFGSWWQPHRPQRDERNQFAKHVWSVESGQFASWWRLRDQLRLQVSVTSDSLKIVNHSHKLTDRWTPMLEIWRNQHVARIPLDRSTLVLQQSGMVYCREPFRHPAGLFLSQGLATPVSPRLTRSVSQSV